MRAGLRTRGGAAGRCQRIGTGTPARSLHAALTALWSVAHHPKSAQELSACVVGSEGGSPCCRPPNLHLRPQPSSPPTCRSHAPVIQEILWLCFAETAPLSTRSDLDAARNTLKSQLRHTDSSLSSLRAVPGADYPLSLVTLQIPQSHVAQQLSSRSDEQLGFRPAEDSLPTAAGSARALQLRRPQRYLTATREQPPGSLVGLRRPRRTARC